jgi:hypothetical protein
VLQSLIETKSVEEGISHPFVYACYERLISLPFGRMKCPFERLDGSGIIPKVASGNCQIRAGAGKIQAHAAGFG